MRREIWSERMHCDTRAVVRLNQTLTNRMSKFLTSAGCLFWAVLACCLVHAFKTAASVVRLNGSFVQYHDEMQGWSPETWGAVLARMKELRMDTVVIQMLVRENQDGSLHSFIKPSSQPDATEIILDWADTNDFKVLLGLYLPNWNHDMTGSGFLAETQTRMAGVAQEAWERYLSGNRHRSFAGWYLPYEPWTAAYSTTEIDRLRSLFQGVHETCQLLSGDAPLAISPFISSTRPPPCDVERIYTELLHQSGIGIVMLQDSVGAQQWESNVVQQVSPYAQALQRACDATGVQFWANLESFKIEGTSYLPGNVARLRKQLDATAPFVRRFVTFDFVHYMNPVAFLSNWSQDRRQQMQQFFTDYKATFVDQDYAPWGPPTISARLSAGHLTIRWPGAPGDQFQAQFTTNLADGAWMLLNTGIVTNDFQFSIVKELAAQQAERFFRIQRLPALRPPDDMVWIQPGNFSMGTPLNDPNVTPDELSPFEVTLTHGFWMGRYEVTQSEFQNVMCNNPSSYTGNLARPVENVTWHEAMEFCAKLTQQERQAGRLPENHVYRLPSEAEWEYATRAGTTNWFSFGNDSSLLGNYAWFSGNSTSSTHPVGQRQSNPWGLDDMYGNVFEWCWDWIGAAPTQPVTDFRGTTNGPYRAIRGGAWSYPWVNCRSSWRIGYAPGVRGSDLGFRIILAPAGP
jgi:formylglycine-generating enzyme required for sulfatase activity